MAKESTQQKLSRVRPPRVQITYDVEIGDGSIGQPVLKAKAKEMEKQFAKNLSAAFAGAAQGTA